MAERETVRRDGVPNGPGAPIEDSVSTPAATATEATGTGASDAIGDDAIGDDVTAPSDQQRVLPRRRLAVLAVTAVVAFVVDLVTKLVAVAELADRAPIVVVPKVLDLQLTRNPGAAFGLAGGATVIFSVVAVGVVVFIVATARRLRSRGWALALGLLLGGALGNLGDRLFRDPGPLRGHVVDWIHLSHWPIFNIADTCIVVGGLFAVYLSMRGKRLDGTVEVAPPGT